MNFIFVFPIFLLFIGKSLSLVPVLKGHHAYIEDYPKLSTKTCGYLSPKDKDTDQFNGTQSRIINGFNASLGEFPWAVVIFHKYRGEKSFLCGGVLINEFWVMTARHCLLRTRIEDAEIVPSVLNVSLGTLNLRNFYSVKNVSQIVRHPNPDIDVALIRLETAVYPEQSGSSTNPIYRINHICLPSENATNTQEEEAIFSGFGLTEISKWRAGEAPLPRNEQLRKAMIKIESPAECRRLRKNYPSYIICSPQEELMACHGDSGSGLVQFDKNRAMLIGIVSAGVPFEFGAPQCTPGVDEFVRVSHLINFLKQVIVDNVPIRQFIPPPLVPPPPLPPQPMPNPGQPIPQWTIPAITGPHNLDKEANDYQNRNEELESGDNGSEDNLIGHHFIAFNIITLLINILMN